VRSRSTVIGRLDPMHSRQSSTIRQRWLNLTAQSVWQSHLPFHEKLGLRYSVLHRDASSEPELFFWLEL
jgi:hypothetical protein